MHNNESEPDPNPSFAPCAICVHNPSRMPCISLYRKVEFHHAFRFIFHHNHLLSPSLLPSLPFAHFSLIYLHDLAGPAVIKPFKLWTVLGHLTVSLTD